MSISFTSISSTASAPNAALQAVTDYIFTGAKIPKINLPSGLENSSSTLASNFIKDKKQLKALPDIAETIKNGYLNFILSQSNITQLFDRRQGFIASKNLAVQIAYNQSNAFGKFSSQSFWSDKKATTSLQQLVKSLNELINKVNGLYITQTNFAKISSEGKGGNVNIKA
jgi:hypothetical protein